MDIPDVASAAVSVTVEGVVDQGPMPLTATVGAWASILN